MNNTTLSPSSFLLSPSPTFSIIIPVYNVAPYLRECLDSVLAQTFTDWEAICVDDGSTDGSGAILDEYAAKDKRFRVIHQKNAGVSAARNAALDVAQGEWIQFVDADDVIKDTYLADFVALQDKADINFFGVSYFYPSGCSRSCVQPQSGVVSVQMSVLPIRLIDNEMGVNFFGYTWNKLFRGDLIRLHKCRFVEKLYVAEDEIFTFEVAQYAATCRFIATAGYGYRKTGIGLSARRQELRPLTKASVDLLARYASAPDSVLYHFLECRTTSFCITDFLETHSLRSAMFLVAHCRKMENSYFSSRKVARLMRDIVKSSASELWAAILLKFAWLAVYRICKRRFAAKDILISFDELMSREGNVL